MAGERTVKIKFTGESSGVARAARAAERSIEKLRDGAQNTFAKLGDSITSTLSSSGIYGAAGILAAVVAVAPAIGAALTTGILLAFGGGVLALGIASAVKDPKVAAAFTGLKTKAGEIFKKFGEPFKGPLIQAAKTFTDLLTKSVGPALERMGKLVAPLVGPLANALAGMAQNSLPGIEAAVKASVPLFQILAKEAPKFGEAISKFLTSVADGGPGAQKFLEDVLNFLIWILPKVGASISWLADRYIDWRNGVIQAVAAVKSAWNAFYSFFSGVGKKISSTVSSVISAFNSFKDKATSAWNSVVSTISSAVDRIEYLWNKLKDLASSAINFSIGGFSIPGLSGGRAAGGPVMAGRSYLVGEKGPEILTMGSGSGNITPNSALGGGPEVLEVHVDLGNDIQRVISINLKEHNRQLKRTTLARG